MALKRTSEVITVSSTQQQGVVNTFEVIPIDLQLNPLDQEVFVVTAVKIDFLGVLPGVSLAGPSTTFPTERVALSTTRPASMPNLGSSACFGYSDRQCVASAVVDGAGNIEIGAYSVIEQSSSDMPDANLDYLAIIATSDFFISLESLNCLLPLDMAVRVFGYRAKADAATYAALVQSEVLSS